MKGEGLSYFTDTHLTVLALLLFLGAFIVILIQQWNKFDLEKQKYIENLPLNEEGEISMASQTLAGQQLGGENL